MPDPTMDAAAEQEWRIIRPSRRWRPGVSLAELWSHRELLWMLALRDVRLRYRQTLFGIGWAVLRPLVAMAIFALVFGSLTDVPSDGIPYAVFVLCALTFWSFLAAGVGAAAESLVEHRDLVTKVWFPRILAPVAAIGAALVDLMIGLVLLVPVILLAGVEIPWQALTLPGWILAALAVATAAGLWLSAANVLYRDVRYALGYVLQLWLFISPVVFPSSLIDDGWRYVFALNPAAGVIDGMRWSLLDGPAPGAEIAVSLLTCMLLLVSGVVFFSTMERRFADAI